MLTTTVLTLVVVLIFLMSILFTILGERRTLAEIQGREGPSVTGFGGFVQAIVDGMKTFFKAVLVSKRSFKVLFFMLPAGLLLVNIIKFAVLPLSKVGGFVDFEYDLAFLNLLGSFEVFIFVFASWVALSSKFPTIAALRGIAQQCAVEALTGFCFIIVALYAGSLSIRTVVESQEYVWYFFVVTPYAYVYYLAILSELHRTPSDVTEAESELTAGYQVEHGGILFSLFYLSEYGGIVVSAIVFSLLFLGGWFLPLGLGAHSLVLFLKVVSFLW
jgi:NADH-quinone oxidoreductase subunit H